MALQGVEVLNRACEACKASVEASKGRLQVKEAARAVSERDDRMLSLQLATLEAQNKEVAGDDDAEEEDEGMGAIDVDAAPALQI